MERGYRVDTLVKYPSTAFVISALRTFAVIVTYICYSVNFCHIIFVCNVLT